MLCILARPVKSLECENYRVEVSLLLLIVMRLKTQLSRSEAK
jgi:hypothetical protein